MAAEEEEEEELSSRQETKGGSEEEEEMSSRQETKGGSIFFSNFLKFKVLFFFFSFLKLVSSYVANKRRAQIKSWG